MTSRPPERTLPATVDGDRPVLVLTSAPSAATPLRWLATHRRGLVELALLAVLYWGYSLVRSLADDDLARARGTARALLDVERATGTDVEVTLNTFFVRHDALSLAASYWYASAHFVVTVAVLVWLYRCRPRQYAWLRSTLAVATAVALGCYLLVPMAPPRLMAAGYTDVLARTADDGWWGATSAMPSAVGDMTNQLAAFPSMHAGWSLWVAVAVLTSTRSHGLRTLAVGYALVTAVVVVGTGNHWTLDVLAGWVVVGASAAVCRGLARRSEAHQTGLAGRWFGGTQNLVYCNPRTERRWETSL